MNKTALVNKFYGVTCLLLAIAGFSKAQQPFSYTQYMSNLTPLNPAYSLIGNDGSVNMLVRKQWVGIEGAPTTYILNGSIPFQSMAASAGISALNDKIGVEEQAQFNAFFAKSIQLAENQFLGVALTGGVRRYVANYSLLGVNDRIFSNDIHETKATAGFGILYYSNSYYIGIAVPQLTFRNPDNSPISENRFFRNTYYFSGGFITKLTDDIKLKPVTLVTYTRGVPLIADISALFLFKDTFDIGMNYRTNSEMAAIVLFNVNAFHIGYSYLFGSSASNIGGISNATHEVSIGFHFSRSNSRTADSDRQLGL